MAVQFACSVLTEEAFFNRPKDNPTVEKLMQYTIQNDTCISGSYAGRYVYAQVGLN